MNVFIKYTLTVTDFREATGVALGRVESSKPAFGGSPKVRVLSFIFVALMVLLTLYFSHTRGNTSAPVAGHERQSPVAVIIPLVIAIGILIVILMLMNSAKRQNDPRATDEIRTLTADYQRVVLTEPNLKLELAWPAIRAVDETPNLFILYQDDPRQGKQVRFFPIPKRAFTTTESLLEFEKMIYLHLHAKH